MKFSKSFAITIFTFIGMMSYLYLCSLFGRDINMYFLCNYQSLIFFIIPILSYTLSAFEFRRKDVNRLSVFLISFCMIHLTYKASQMYDNYRWNNFLDISKTESSYKGLSKKDSLIVAGYTDIAKILSLKYHSKYEIKFTSHMPDNIYGLTHPYTNTLYFNTNIFLKDDELDLKKKIKDNKECILHELSHVVYINTTKDTIGGHNDAWCKLAKKMGVETTSYEEANKNKISIWTK